MRIFALSIEIAIQLLFPILLAVFFVWKYKISWKIFFIGVLFFIISQILETPFRIGLSLARIPETQLWIYLSFVFAGLIAGIGEELSRFFAFRYVPILKRKADWESGVLYGVGHGAVESILIGLGVLVMALIVFLAPTEVVSKLPKEAVSQFKSLPWYYFIAGGLERIFAITIQIGLSLIVVLSFLRSDLRFLFLAMGIHAFIDASALSFMSWSKNVALVEALILFYALIFLYWILWFKRNIPHAEFLVKKA